MIKYYKNSYYNAKYKITSFYYIIAFINKTSIGNNIAALIEPSETILVSAINTSPKTKQISPICQFVVSNTPTAVATPLPPLNLKILEMYVL